MHLTSLLLFTELISHFSVEVYTLQEKFVKTKPYGGGREGVHLLLALLKLGICLFCLGGCSCHVYTVTVVLINTYNVMHP